MKIENKFLEIGISIDRAIDCQDYESLEKSNRTIDKYLNSGGLGEHTISTLRYWQANIYSGLMPNPKADVPSLTEKQVAALRIAISTKNFHLFPDTYQVQVRTNLGNIFQHLERPIEAIEQYNLALKIMPNYSLTLANRARSFTGYARISNDAGHQNMLLFAAVQSYMQAASKEAVFETDEQLLALPKQFGSLAEGISTRVDETSCKEALSKYETSFGRSKAERAYRRFCLDNVLFLNVLNEAYTHPICANDTLTLSNITKHIDESNIHPPLEFSIFNRIKQEYIAARYLYYESISSQGIHFSDRDVTLADTYDYTLHGIAFEKLRIAYRSAYSVLDRVAVLANHYWQLNHKTTELSFSSVWYEKRNSLKLHSAFQTTENIAIFGLIELSKDLHSKERSSVSEPDAKLLADLRNALEHRFVEVTDDFAMLETPYVDIPKSLHVRIPLSIIEDRTLRMLRIARNACIYVALAINVDEQRKQGDRGELFGSSPILNFPERNKGR